MPFFHRIIEVSNMAGIFLAAATAASASSVSADAPYFTKDQASAGKSDYKAHCAVCHGGNLKGQAGPALAGKKFSSSLNFSKMSAQQLFSFISEHMPKNQPGSLPHQKYQEIFAYLLCVNGFKPGDKALNDQTLGKIDLLPLPSETVQPCD